MIWVFGLIAGLKVIHASWQDMKNNSTSVSIQRLGLVRTISRCYPRLKLRWLFHQLEVILPARGSMIAFDIVTH